MQGLVLVALAIAMVAVVFALQNIAPVTVAFLTWTFEGSLALVLFVALVAGALISFFASIPALVKGRSTAAGLRKKIAWLEAELDDSRRRVEAAPTRAQGAPAPRAGPRS